MAPNEETNVCGVCVSGNGSWSFKNGGYQHRLCFWKTGNLALDTTGIE